MSKKFALLAIVILLTSLVLSACGGGGSGGGGTNIESTLTDFKFEPSSWSVPAGKQISLKLTNNGAVEHTWVLMTKPVTPPAPQNSPDALFTAKVAPGQSQTFTFTSPTAPGDYEVICDVPGHLEANMVGKLTVTQP